jgi:diguanylate cyclase (GGDEF)-like protein/PAS domain S-box-containing protein
MKERNRPLNIVVITTGMSVSLCRLLADTESILVRHQPFDVADLNWPGPISADVIIIEVARAKTEWRMALERCMRMDVAVPIFMFLLEDAEDLGELSLSLGAADYMCRRDARAAPFFKALSLLVRLQAVESLQLQAARRTEIILDSIGDAVVIADAEARITHFNPVAEQLTGIAAKDACNRLFHEIIIIEDQSNPGVALNPIANAISEGRIVKLPDGCDLVRRDGRKIGIEDAASPIHETCWTQAGAIMVFHDVTKARELARRVAHLANHDSLTGLPGRHLLQDRISQAVAVAKRDSHALAVMFIDLDRFKLINDVYGHSTGDALLTLFAGRLGACVRKTDTVVRQGGDEFVVLLPKLKDTRDALHVANMILAANQVPYDIGSRQIHVTASVGIAVFPQVYESAEILLHQADIAMLSAKHCGRNSSRLYSPFMEEARSSLSIEAELSDAIEHSSFELSFQPQFRMKCMTMVGAEALIRWNHREHGPISPEAFIQAAERSGHIVPIGRWVLDQACRRLRNWQLQHSVPLRMAINVSAVELRASGYVENLRRSLALHQIDPRQIELELTETALIGEPQTTIQMLNGLRTLGFRIALDDFGTGFSSLSYLKTFPIDVIKIDRSFVGGLCSNEGDASIVTAIVRLAEAFRLEVIAEGVESQEQVAALMELGCGLGQGFHLREPLNAKDFQLCDISCRSGLAASGGHT